MNREAKVEFLKNIMDGNVPKEAVNPPKFKMKIKKDGYFYCTIDGKSVSHTEYLSEKERLLVTDDSFSIEMRKPAENTL